MSEKTIELDTAKGTRDIPPQDQRTKEYILNTIKAACERYGFDPLDTPLLERYDVLSAKFAAGEESDAMKEVYTLEDLGQRKLGLRFDLTVPLCRYIAMNRQVKAPFKRYQIGKVYRDAPTKSDRFREFTQCDADIIGTDNILADATILRLALDVYAQLNLDVTIRVNNRKLLNAILESNGIDEKKRDTVMITIDKLDKIGEEGVKKELADKGVAQINVDKLMEILKQDLDYFRTQFCDATGSDELNKLFNLVDDPRIKFDATLVRGLGYYTGTVMEVEDNTKKITSSIGAGGRYDKIINSYLDAAGVSTDRNFAAVGFSFGVDRMALLLETQPSSSVQLFIVPLGTEQESFTLATALRNEGIATDMDILGKGLSKNLTLANQKNIPYALIVGENEVSEQKYTLKNLKEGSEEKIELPQLVEKLKQEN